MDERYADLYEDLYNRHWWWRARETYVVRTITEEAAESGFGRILDVGCGNGLFFPHLERFGEPWGVETEKSLVAETNRWRERIEIVPFERYEAEPGSFGLIVMLDVLEHMKSPAEALVKAHRLLTPGGKLVVTLPAFNCLWTHHDDLNHHVERYRRPMFRRMVDGSGLVMRRCNYFFHWLFPLKIAVRLFEGKVPAESDEHMTVVPSDLVNTVMGWGCRVEQLLLHRMPLPFGSSLFAVLQKDGAGD